MTMRTARGVAGFGLVLALVAGCGSDPEPSTPDAAASTPGAVEPTAEVSAAPSAPATASASPGATSPGASPGATSPGASPGAASPGATAAPSTPAPSKPPKAASDRLKRGDSGAAVLALQQRLDELGYWLGTPDGNYGLLTVQAVYALQKAAGLGRDGVVGPKTKRALDKGTRPKAKSKKGKVLEINLARQLLLIVDGGEVTQIFNTATGSNENYTHEGRTYLARTPKGKFKIGRQINDWRYGPLGPLYRPKYFNGGIALHGAHSVPPYPASHGCARLTVTAMDWVWKHGGAPIGTSVWVY